jgi:hypothetical protein
MDTEQILDADDDEGMSIGILLERSWAGRWLIGGLMIAAVFLVFVAMHFMTPRYTASMLVASLPENSGGGLSALAGNSTLQSLAGSVGMGGVGGAQTENFNRFIQSLSSNELAERLARDPRIMHHLFWRQWDTEHQRWRQHVGLLAFLSDLYRSYLKLPPWHPPGAQELSEYLSRALSVSPVPRSQFQQVDFVDRDPAFAQAILQRVYRESEDILRIAAASTARKQSAYIERRLESTTMNADNRVALIQLDVDIERKRMLAESNAPFAADILDPPHVGNLPTSPKPVLYLALAAMFGLIAGLVLSFLVGAAAVAQILSRLWPGRKSLPSPIEHI